VIPFGDRKKNISEDLFSLVFSQFKKISPPGNLNFNYLGLFQSLKLRISIEKILSISLKLNFTPITFGCYGLMSNKKQFFFKCSLDRLLFLFLCVNFKNEIFANV